MNDNLTDDDVEDRLRRTFLGRAHRMAEGDGTGWDPSEITHTLVPLGVSEAERRRGTARRRTLVAAAATLTVGGLAAAALAGGSGSPAGDDDGSTTASSSRQPAASAAAGTIERCEPWNMVFTATETEPGTPPMTFTRPGNGELISLQVDTTPADPSWGHQISAKTEGAAADFEPSGTDELLDINGRPGWFSVMEGNDEMAWITVDYDGDLVVVVAMQVAKADAIGFAESLERQADGTWEYLVLPEYESYCPAPL